MTGEELAKLPFRMVSHMAAEDFHVATYMNDEYGIVVSKQTRMKDGTVFGRSTVHYMHNGKLYKSKKKFLEAISDM